MNPIRRWVASALTKLSRNRSTGGPRVRSYRLPDGGVGYLAEGGRGGQSGQDGEDGAGPHGGKGGRGGGGGGGGGGGRARSAPYGPRSFTYGQALGDTHPEER